MKTITLVFAFLIILFSSTNAQIGSVQSYQQITTNIGGFTAILDNVDAFGVSMDTIGDLNNDGIMDIAVGACLDDDGGTDRGAIYILYLDTNKTVKSYSKISSTSGNLSCALANLSQFGISVCGLGDLDNDGVPDIAVGAYYDPEGGSNTGSVRILFMNSNGTVKSCQKISSLSGYGTGGLPLVSGKLFGVSVKCIGDINNDYISDIVVGNSADNGGGTNKGACWVLTLDTNGTVKTHYKIYDGVTNFNAPIDNNDAFGNSVCGIGDIDNDNIPDIAVGAFYDDDGGLNCGAVYIIKLNSNGSVKGFYKISNGNNGIPSNAIAYYSSFGQDVTSTCDIDGNGTKDLLVGAYRYGSDKGAVYIIGLNSNSTASVIKIISYLDIPLISGSIRFGWSVAHIGDINNDGKIEIAAGAPYYNSTRGEIFIMSINVNSAFNAQSLFLFPDTAYRNCQTQVANLSTGNSFYWNFCQGGTYNYNSANFSNIGTFPNVASHSSSALVKDGNNYYLFSLNHYNGKLVRLFFGNSLDNTPTWSNLSITNIPTGTEAIDIQYDNGSWYGYIIGGSMGNHLRRLSFGSSLSNSPTITSVSASLQSYPVDLHLVKDGSNWYGLTANYVNNTITRLSFGSSLANNPSIQHFSNLGLSTPTGVCPVFLNNSWYLFVGNKQNNSITRISFGSSLSNNPTSQNLGNPSNLLVNPRDITILWDCNNIFGYVCGENNSLYKLSFTNGITGAITAQTITSNGSVNFPHSFSNWLRSGDNIYTFTTNLGNNTFTKIKVPSCLNPPYPSQTVKHPQPFIFTTNGNYTINLLVDEGQANQSCYSKSFVVVDNNMPIPVISSNAPVCEGDMLWLNGSAGISSASYIWNGPNNYSSTQQNNVFLNAQTNLSGNYILQTSANNCLSDPDTLSVSVNANPIINLSGILNQYCIDDALVNLSASPPGGTFYINNNQTSILNPSVLGVGTHNLKYSVTNSNQCSNADSMNININPLPTVSFTGLDSIYCLYGNPSILLGIPSGGTFSGTGISGNTFNPVNAGVGTYSIIYSYSDNNACINYDTNETTVLPPTPLTISGLLSDYCIDNPTVTLTGSPSGGTFLGSGISGNTFSPINAGTGTHNIGYLYIDQNGCSNNTFAQVIVHPKPNTQISGLGNTYCTSSPPVTMIGTPTGGTFSGSGVTSNIFNPFNAGVGTHIISYSFIDTYGCFNSAFQSVSVFPQPTVSFSGLSNQYCLNSTPVTLTGNPSGGQFSGPGISGTTFNPSTAGSGYHMITYTSLPDINGCSNTDTQYVNVNPLPIVNFTGLGNSYCINSPTVNLVGTPTGGTFSGAGILNTSFNPSIAGLGIKSITYSYIDINNCSNSLSINTSIFDLPVVNAGLNDSVCKGDTVYLNNATAQNYSSLIWSSNGTGIFSNNSITNPYYIPSLTDIQSGNNTFTLIANGISPCGNNSAQKTVIYLSLPTVSFSGLDSVYCKTDAIANLTGSPASGTFSGNGIINNSFNPNLAINGENIIQYSFSDVNGCQNSSFDSTTVYDEVIVSIGSVNNICAGDNIILQNATTVNNSSIFWHSSGNGTFGSTLSLNTYYIPNINDIINGSVKIYLDALTLGPCSSKTDSVTIIIHALPSLSIQNLNSSYCKNSNPVLINATPSGGYLIGNGITGNMFTPSNAPSGVNNITYLYTDGNGCSNSVTSQTTIYDTTNISFLGLPQEVCHNENPILLTGNPIGGTFSGNGISGNIFNPSIINIGKHFISYSYINANNCSSLITDSVNIITPPNVNVGQDTALCSNDTLFLININVTDFSSLQWITSGDGIFSSYVTSNPYYVFGINDIQIGNVTLYLKAFGNGPCNYDIDSLNVLIHPLPNLTFSGLSTQYCITSPNIQLIGNPSGGSFSGQGMSNNTFSPSQAGIGIHSIIYQFINLFGCVGFYSQSTTVNSLPTVTLNSFSDVCVDAATFTLSGGNPAGGTYSGTSVSSGSFNPATAGIGTHIITYSYTDANSCTNSTTQNIIVNALPTVTLSSFNNVCLNSAPFSLTGGNPSGGTYSGTGVSSGSFNPAIAGVGTHLITYSYTDGNNCTNSTTQNIIVNGLPTVTLSSFSDVCVDAAAFTLTGGSPSGGTYSGTGVSNGNFYPVIAGAGTHLITYSYTDGNNCTNSSTQNIIVNPLPIVSYSGLASAYCYDDPQVAIVPNPIGGTLIGYGISGMNFTPSVAGVGIHTITYIYTDANACFGSYSQNVTVNPNYFYQQNMIICDNDSVLFAGNYLKSTGIYYDSLTTIGGCDSIYELQLFVNLPYHFVEQDTVCSGDSLLWQGSYYSFADTFLVNYNSINSCDSIYELQLFVNPTYYFVEQDTVCSGDSLFWHGNYYSVANTFYANYNSINGCDSIYELQLFVNPTYHFVEQDTIFSNDSLLWQGNYYSVADTFFAYYNSINGCDSIYELRLIVNPIYYFVEKDTICSGDSLLWQGNYYSVADTFFAYYNSINGYDSIYELQLTVNPSYYQVPVSTGICQGDSIFLGGAYQSTAGVYYDDFLTLAGCDSSVVTTLTINPLPIVTVSVFPDSIEKGDCAELTASGGINYSWKPITWLDNPLIATPKSCPDSSIIYYVEVTDVNGCKNIDSIIVIVYFIDDFILFAPNTFTPNGDGKNDKWVIKNIDKFSGNKVVIYNRWGNKVFSATNYKNDWDGNNLPIGTYFYIIDLNNGKKPLKGDINILR